MLYVLIRKAGERHVPQQHALLGPRLQAVGGGQGGGGGGVGMQVGYKGEQLQHTPRRGLVVTRKQD